MCDSIFPKGKLLWGCTVCFFDVCEVCGYKAVHDSLDDQRRYRELSGNPVLDEHSSEQSGGDVEKLLPHICSD